MAIQVKLVFGHTAQWRKKQTPEGFTHDWTVLVRGEEGNDIKHFVEKVIFHLHESFPKSKRPVKDPPFQIKESGYGSFNMVIEVFFKNKDEPKSQKFEYDLLLPNNGDSPINLVRSEALTFQAPNEEFKAKLIKSGGVLLSDVKLQKPKEAKRPDKDKSAEEEARRKKPRLELDKDKKPKKEQSDDEEGSKSDITSSITNKNWDTNSLKKLHKQLNNISDTQKLQQIVNLVETTGQYTLTKSTFDFDLCKLDSGSLNKLYCLIEEAST